MSDKYEKLDEARLSRQFMEAKKEIERLREAVWRAEADAQMHKLQVRNAYIENSRLRELVDAQEELLACYRLGRQPSRQLMYRIDTLKKANGGGG